MNTIIPVFMFSILIIFGVIGIIYTLKNNEKLHNIVSKDKMIAQYGNLKIRDIETLKMNFWTGNLKIYESTLLIENSTYFHHIILDKNKQKEKKHPMAISLNQISIEKNSLILQGVKYRVFGNSNIKIRIKSDNENIIIDINKTITDIITKAQ